MLVLIVDYLCFVPISAAVLLPVLYGIFGSDGLDLFHFANGGWWGACILALASIGILARHTQNLRRIALGTELHFSYLWSRDKEAELNRIQENEKKYQKS